MVRGRSGLPAPYTSTSTSNFRRRGSACSGGDCCSFRRIGSACSGGGGKQKKGRIGSACGGGGGKVKKVSGGGIPPPAPPRPPSSSCKNTVASTRCRWRDMVRIDADVGDHYSDPTMKEIWYSINSS